MTERVRRFELRRFASVVLLVGGSACAGPGREPVTRAERLEFERDHERCVLQSEDSLGVRRPADYRACMQARGWSAPPD